VVANANYFDGRAYTYAEASDDFNAVYQKLHKDVSAASHPTTQDTAFGGAEAQISGACHFAGEHTTQDFQGYLQVPCSAASAPQPRCWTRCSRFVAQGRVT
jgi:hypothetical protein